MMGFYNLSSVLLKTGTSPSGVFVGEKFSNESNTVILLQVHDIYIYTIQLKRRSGNTS